MLHANMILKDTLTFRRRARGGRSLYVAEFTEQFQVVKSTTTSIEHFETRGNFSDDQTNRS